EETRGRERRQEEWRVAHYARNARHGYRGLDSERRNVVFAALEMSLWSTSFVVAMLIFYFFELSFPLGLLTIAGVARLVYCFIRRIISLWRGPTKSPPAML